MKSILKFTVLSAFFLSITSCEKEETFKASAPEVTLQSQADKLLVYEDGDTFVINGQKNTEKIPKFFLMLENKLPNTLELVALNGQKISTIGLDGNPTVVTIAPGETMRRFFSGLGSNPGPGIVNQDITFKYNVDGFDNYISFGGFVDINDEDNIVLKVNASHSNNFEDATQGFERYDSDYTALIYSPYAGSGLSDQISSTIKRSEFFIPGSNNVLYDLEASVSRN